MKVKMRKSFMQQTADLKNFMDQVSFKKTFYRIINDKLEHNNDDEASFLDVKPINLSD